MRWDPLCRDLVGRTAVLARDVVSGGGTRIRKGETVRLKATWTGRFTIAAEGETGNDRRSISRVPRSALVEGSWGPPPETP